MNLWYGNTAGVARVNNYAKSVTAGKNIKVYLFSVQNLKSSEDLIEVENNIYSSIQKLNYKPKFGIANLFRNIWFIKDLYKVMKYYQLKGAVIMYPSFSLSFNIFVFLFLKFFGCASVYCEVNEVRKYSINTTVNSLKSIFKKPLLLIKIYILENIWRFFDGLICISTHIERYAHHYNTNTIVVPILADMDKVKFEDFKKKKNESFIILFTGSISIIKDNLMEFLIALKMLNNISQNWIFNMCGQIDFTENNIIKNFINQEELTERVRYLGNLSHSEVIKLQQEASLLVLPRQNTPQNYYGFSTKLAEYSISGTPILMTDTGVVTKYFSNNYNCYMVDGYSSHVFFEKLIHILSVDNDTQYTIAQNAFQTANKYFNYRNYTEDLSTFLRLRDGIGKNNINIETD